MSKYLIFLLVLLILGGCTTFNSVFSPSNGLNTELKLTEQGLANINQTTLLNNELLNKALNNRYRLRYGMSMENGQMVAFYQGLQQDSSEQQEKALITFYGFPKGNVERIEIIDTTVSSWAVKIGTPFSDIYAQAFGLCSRDSAVDVANVICQSPQDDHVSYVFSGEWSGSDSLLPSDAVLKNWLVSKLVWQARAEISADTVAETSKIVTKIMDIQQPPAIVPELVPPSIN